ncbi:hypothetical protein JAAARDRAFT_51307 [Jaapia argillacea MUCL 33604]|uniref:Uncharacterized protein n=1 Tax=Jaapia argillacea MUCL 33604 TaxID=933084 RepID=A0A067PJ46_9AGAM|nr:hypothetical protein JAAARDRAFT_51307 [Jaapia argillacea MUCL 33604]
MSSLKPKQHTVKTTLKSAFGAFSAMWHEDPSLLAKPTDVEEFSLLKIPDEFQDLGDWLPPCVAPNPLPVIASRSLTESPNVTPISLYMLEYRVANYLQSSWGENHQTSAREIVANIAELWRNKVAHKFSTLTHHNTLYFDIGFYIFLTVNELSMSPDPQAESAGRWRSELPDMGVGEICHRWVLRNRNPSMYVEGPFDSQAFVFIPSYLTPEVFELLVSWKGTGPPTRRSTENDQSDNFARAETIWYIIVKQCIEERTDQFVISSWNQWAFGYFEPMRNGGMTDVHLTPILPCTWRDPAIIMAMATWCHGSWKDIFGWTETSSRGLLAVSGQRRQLRPNQEDVYSPFVNVTYVG